MTYKEFRAWCNDRACDGCWSIYTAMICIDIMAHFRDVPFWRRKKEWNKVKDEVVDAIVEPINMKIEEQRAHFGKDGTAK